MAVNNVLNKYGFSKTKKETQYDQTLNATQKIRNINPQTPEPSKPIQDQAKEKLTTSKYFRAIYKKEGVFPKFNNLSINDMKYIFDDFATRYYVDNFGANDVKKLPDFENYKTLKDQMPDKLVGGGEGDPLIAGEDIDLKNMYNSEAKALAVAYYSNSQNLKDIKKMLYSIASVYANGGFTDLDELKKEVEKVDFNKLSNEEIKLEFQKIFAKTMRRDSGKMLFIKSMLDRIDNLQKEIKQFEDIKLKTINDKYALMYEREFKELFKVDKEVIVDDFIDALKTLSNTLKDNETINDLKVNENTPEEIKEALRIVKESRANILDDTGKELREKLEKFESLERLARKGSFASKIGKKVILKDIKYNVA